jgi:predicted DCC family thiol-disulfide oxidoreductase YuxK
VGTGSREENALKKRELMVPWPDDDVILYDGVCVFCSRWVRFVATRDVAKRFRFTAIQSPYGTRLAQAFGINPDDPDTNAVIHGGVAYFKSDAALTVLGALPGWGWVRILIPDFWEVRRVLRAGCRAAGEGDGVG